MADIPTFPNGLIDAVSAAGHGFRFEEGGCFAMALALSGKLTAMGVANVPALMSNIDHAIVLLLDKPGLWLDHMGYDDAPVDAVQTDETGLREAAAACGWDEDQFESDLADARDVIEAACEAEAAPEPA